MIALIAAIDRERAIGHENRLLFRLPNDLKRFKALTTGHTVLMGRKTFHSLPKGALPQRRNMVLSRDAGLSLPDVEVFTSLEDALGHTAAGEQVFVIGGAEVYRQAMPLADVLFLTEIQATAPLADAYFPPVDLAVWHEESRDAHLADEKHPCDYHFVTYRRK